MMFRIFFIVIVLFSSLKGVAQGGLLFSDDFIDNRYAWPIINTDFATTDIRDGYYFLQHHRTVKALSVKKHVAIDESRDYMIVAELVKFSREKNPVGFGILWGRSDEDNEYNFLVSSKGNFKILRKFHGKVQTIVDWHPSKYIQKEQGLNRLSIKKVGDEMIFYVNHHQVAKTKLLPFFGDLVGIKVYHQQKLGVRSFKVYQR